MASSRHTANDVPGVQGAPSQIQFQTNKFQTKLERRIPGRSVCRTADRNGANEGQQTASCLAKTHRTRDNRWATIQSHSKIILWKNNCPTCFFAGTDFPARAHTHTRIPAKTSVSIHLVAFVLFGTFCTGCTGVRCIKFRQNPIQMS